MDDRIATIVKVDDTEDVLEESTEFKEILLSSSWWKNHPAWSAVIRVNNNSIVNEWKKPKGIHKKRWQKAKKKSLKLPRK